jgi:hypothetical protein
MYLIKKNLRPQYTGIRSNFASKYKPAKTDKVNKWRRKASSYDFFSLYLIFYNLACFWDEKVKGVKIEQSEDYEPSSLQFLRNFSRKDNVYTALVVVLFWIIVVNLYNK